MKLLDIILAATFFSIVGLFSYSQFYSNYFVKFRYESTEGRIISSEIEQFEQEEIDGEFTKTVTAFRPKLLYEYKVGEIKYFGTRYRAFRRGEDRMWAEQIVKELPAGKEIAVFYNPQNPEKSVLSKEASKNFFEKLIFIAIFLVLGSIAYYRTYYSQNKKYEPVFTGFENLAAKSQN